ncbi:MAG TPA: undecaprenyl/decaprenyl-phosphate alpha-N-acetylglucosaminyl 1-phosphate transferase, partial [Cytophagales bacterium]|nr:undecaprenyl/decaprenyl-phosphate alpha-N-acetylglucosaminyl 1-phosphate transferase [Cytophagales bacterium]
MALQSSEVFIGLAFVTAILVSFFLIPVIIRLIKKKNILDTGGKRKIHKGKKPTMGGIAIFSGFIFAVILWVPLGYVKFMLGAFSIIFITGLRDDLIPVRPVVKLISQLVAAGIMVGLCGVELTSLYGFLGIGSIPAWLGYPITIFTIIVISNAYNLIDGLDGLAGTIGILALSFFGVYFYLVGEAYWAIILAALVGGIIGFLFFNWEPSKIFMGDTGSLFIGFVLASAAIHFIDTNYYLSTNNTYRFTSSIGTAVAVIIMPLFDTLRVFISRAIRKQSPFSPDKTHIHHLIMRMGFNHARTVLIMLGIASIFQLVAIFIGYRLEENLMILLVVSMAMGCSLVLDYLIARRFPKKEA